MQPLQFFFFTHLTSCLSPRRLQSPCSPQTDDWSQQHGESFKRDTIKCQYTIFPPPLANPTEHVNRAAWTKKKETKIFSCRTEPINGQRGLTLTDRQEFYHLLSNNESSCCSFKWGHAELCSRALRLVQSCGVFKCLTTQRPSPLVHRCRIWNWEPV